MLAGAVLEVVLGFLQDLGVLVADGGGQLVLLHQFALQVLVFAALPLRVATNFVVQLASARIFAQLDGLSLFLPVFPLGCFSRFISAHADAPLGPLQRSAVVSFDGVDVDLVIDVFESSS